MAAGRGVALGVATGRLFILEQMTHVHMHINNTNREQYIDGLDSTR